MTLNILLITLLIIVILRMFHDEINTKKYWALLKLYDNYVKYTLRRPDPDFD